MTPIRPFALRLPGRVRFGRGAVPDAVPEIAALGPRLLLVHGRTASRAAPLRAALEEAGCGVTAFACPGEPSLKMLEEALRLACEAGPDAVVAIGGGAALDLGKAVAALLPSGGAALDHLEVVGPGRPLTADPLPCVAIPTTAGTGSEATKNAVIAVPERERKVSLRDDRMVPDLAVIDPAMTDGTPAPQTLASGLDAVTQVIEPWLSLRATLFTDALARPAMEDGLAALVALMEDGENAGARDRLAYTSHVSGVALANAGLGAVNGLAGPMGGMTGAPHGAICARLLPHVLMALAAADDLDARTRDRLAEMDDIFDRVVPGGLAGLEAWADRHGLPAVPGLEEEPRRRVAKAAQGASSMKPSPVAFSADALSDILSRAFPVL